MAIKLKIKNDPPKKDLLTKVYSIVKNPPNKKNPPKREPIVVSDINDPRLKAYQDSLSAYNENERHYKGVRPYTKELAKQEGLDYGWQPNWVYHPDLWHADRRSHFVFIKDIVKKPVQPVIFKAREKEKIIKIEPTAKKINSERLKVAVKKEPSKTKEAELTYRVEYFDPKTRQMTHKMFASEKEGSQFQKSLPSEYKLYGTRGYYEKI